MHGNESPDHKAAHHLIELLSGDKIAAVRGLLEVLVDPLARSLAEAAVEDEVLNDEPVVALELSRSTNTRG